MRNMTAFLFAAMISGKNLREFSLRNFLVMSSRKRRLKNDGIRVG